MRKELIFCDICEETFSGDCIPFFFNGQQVDVCGAACFVRFWSEEYGKAQMNKHAITVSTGISVIKNAITK